MPVTQKATGVPTSPGAPASPPPSQSGRRTLRPWLGRPVFLEHPETKGSGCTNTAHPQRQHGSCFSKGERHPQLLGWLQTQGHALSCCPFFQEAIGQPEPLGWGLCFVPQVLENTVGAKPWFRSHGFVHHTAATEEMGHKETDWEEHDSFSTSDFHTPNTTRGNTGSGQAPVPEPAFSPDT